MVHFLEIYFAFRTVPAAFLANAGNKVPAGNGEIEYCRALFADFFTASPDVPAGRNGQKLFDSRNIETIVSEKLAQTFEPLKIVVGIEPLPPPPGGPDQPLFFVNPEGPRMNVKQFCHNANGIESLLMLYFHKKILQ
jgi:hypothetical protein